MGFSVVEAFRREKQIRVGSGRAMIRLISGLNPEWGGSCPALPQGPAGAGLAMTGD